MCLFLFSGFVQGEAGAEPRLMQFHPNFQHGALLTVVGFTLNIIFLHLPCCVTKWVTPVFCVEPPHSLTSSVKRLSLFSVLVQWKNHTPAFLLSECWRPSLWPQWQSTAATPSEQNHRPFQPVALHRAAILTCRQPTVTICCQQM